MRLHREILFTPAGEVTLSGVEAPAVHALPPPDDTARDTVISNTSGEVAFVRFGGHEPQAPQQGHADFSHFRAHALELRPGHDVLLRHTDGSHGAAAATASEVTISGRARVRILRGTASDQMVFASR
jgi:hypothetical protein